MCFKVSNFVLYRDRAITFCQLSQYVTRIVFFTEILFVNIPAESDDFKCKVSDSEGAKLKSQLGHHMS
jgi:hypothetical protein